MGKISKKVLKRIEEENIKPIGKWSFVLKNSFLWSLFGLNILFGSIGFAISIYLFQSSDLLNLILSVNDFVQILILSIPSIWSILTLVFLLVAYLNLKYTPRGYIFSVWKIFLLNTLVIIVLGILLNSLGISEKLNNIFSKSFSSYDMTLDPRYKIWSNPEGGYIAGIILSIEDDTLQIQDLERNILVVDISEARVRRSVGLIEGEKIKVVGYILEKDIFKASDILPWEGRRKNMQENHY